MTMDNNNTVNLDNDTIMKLAITLADVVLAYK